MKALVLFVGILALSAVTCSKAKVEVLDKTASASLLRCAGDGNYPNNEYTYTWREKCIGRVTNKSERMAFEVRVSAQFSSGRQADALVDKVNLDAGEVASFSLYGDTLHTYSHGYPPDTWDNVPSVSASVSVRWE
jgi:hypothetical protein